MLLVSGFKWEFHCLLEGSVEDLLQWTQASLLEVRDLSCGGGCRIIINSLIAQYNIYYTVSDEVDSRHI